MIIAIIAVIIIITLLLLIILININVYNGNVIKESSHLMSLGFDSKMKDQ